MPSSADTNLQGFIRPSDILAGVWNSKLLIVISAVAFAALIAVTAKTFLGSARSSVFYELAYYQTSIDNRLVLEPILSPNRMEVMLRSRIALEPDLSKCSVNARAFPPIIPITCSAATVEEASKNVTKILEFAEAIVKQRTSYFLSEIEERILSYNKKIEIAEATQKKVRKLVESGDAAAMSVEAQMSASIVDTSRIIRDFERKKDGLFHKNPDDIEIVNIKPRGTTSILSLSAIIGIFFGVIFAAFVSIFSIIYKNGKDSAGAP